MNRKIFWTGLGLQVIHLIILVALFSPSIDWSFINIQFLSRIGYVLFNGLTLIMIIVGIFRE